MMVASWRFQAASNTQKQNLSHAQIQTRSALQKHVRAFVLPSPGIWQTLHREQVETAGQVGGTDPTVPS